MPWKKELADSFKSVPALLAHLELEPDQLHAGQRALFDKADYQFPMLVTKHFANLMEKGNPNDPLLLQCLPTAGELITADDFVEQPLEETGYATPVPNIIHKYANRLLFLPKGSCAINCRYCFRRNFPYHEQVGSHKKSWLAAFDYIAQAGVNELIFSGGDPLMMSDSELEFVIDNILAKNQDFCQLYTQVTGKAITLAQLGELNLEKWAVEFKAWQKEESNTTGNESEGNAEAKDYSEAKGSSKGSVNKTPLPITTFRFHSRLPIVLPNRISDTFIALINKLETHGIKSVIVLHCNHAQEIDATLAQRLAALRAQTSITLLNQSVLLKGINDDAQVLKQLSDRLFRVGVLPYYLHLFDKVKGGVHFYVDDERAQAIYKELQVLTSGYLVPKLAREEPQVPHKTLFVGATSVDGSTSDQACDQAGCDQITIKNLA